MIYTTEELNKELKRINYKKNYIKVLLTSFKTLIFVVAIAIILVNFVFQTLKVTGTSMQNTLDNGDYVLLIDKSEYEVGDIIAFYYNNKILVKRIIAKSSDYVDIDEDGNVYVNNSKLEEDYVINKSIGDCDITLPYQVDDESYFVLGDSREDSLDSRLESIGTVSEENVIGKVILKIYPSLKLVK